MNGNQFDAIARAIARAGGARFDRRVAVLGSGAAGLTRLFRGTASAQQNQATPIFNLQQVVFDLEYDVEKIFAYVRQNFAYEPYAGVLRGARGSYVSGGGNSADLTLLLKAMLEIAQVQTRFVSGTLSSDSAAAMERNLTGDLATAQTVIHRLLSATTGELVQTAAPNEEQIAFAEELLPLAGKRLLDRSHAEYDANLQALLDAYETAGLDIPVPAVALPERERANHVWLQYAAGTEWIDMDPSGPDAEIGTAYATGDGTADTLPEDWHHRVKIAVNAEFVRGGQPTLEEVLTFESPVADLATKPLTMMHIKPGWLGGSIADTIAGTESYEPTLLIDDQVIKGTQLAFSTGGGVLSALGESVNAEGQPTGEWMDFEIISPDRDPSTSRRKLFDRLTPEERLGSFDYETLPPIPIVDSPELGPVFLPMLGIFSFAVHGGPIGNGFFQRDYTTVDAAADRSAVAHGYSFARERVQKDLLVKTGHRFFHDGPNITAFVLEPTELTDAGLSVGIKLDLVHRRLGALPVSDAAPEKPAHPQIMAGAISHATERGIMEAASVVLEADMPFSFRGVSDVFARARDEKVPIRVFKAGDNPEDLQISIRAKAGIAAALALGHVVAVPERALDLAGELVTGWWQIDPFTGRAFDVMEDGSGSTAPEYALLIFKMAEVIECALAVGNILVSIVNVVNEAIGDFRYHYPAHVGGHEALGLIACAAMVMH
jgi:hypothetical protein